MVYKNFLSSKAIEFEDVKKTDRKILLQVGFFSNSVTRFGEYWFLKL